MGRSLSLAAYRAWSRRGESAAFEAKAPRPSGELVWIHAGEQDNLLAVLDLAQRIVQSRKGLNILVTVPDVATVDPQHLVAVSTASILIVAAPADHPETVEKFLAYWNPDMGIWVWGGMRPNLVLAALDRNCPLALIDGDLGGFDGRRDRWLPEVTRSLLSEFAAILVRSGRALGRMEQLGLESERIVLLPPLQAGGRVLPCQDSDLAELSGSLAGRPVWLAVGGQSAEISTILSAHRRALRLSHRLLLILHPADGVSVQSCQEAALSDEFRVLVWPSDGDPNDSTQIMISDDTQFLGLFYRVAPVSFLGSSLVPGHGGRNPFEAAALGSAVLYGPNVGRFLPFYTRLVNAGAARIVNDAQALGTAITRLIAPDQAAAMAHAGWDVISEGAAVMDRVSELVQFTLDDAKVAN